MTEDELQESRISKIMKLLSKAESTTPEEAELLSEKAQELMARWAIDDAMLAIAQGAQQPDKIIEKKTHFFGIYATSHRELAFAVGNGNDFYLIQGSGYTTNDKGQLVKSMYSVWVGFEREIAAAEVLLASLLIQAERAQRVFMKEWNADHGWATAFEKATARRSFLDGFAHGIQQRLMAARLAAKKAAEAEYQSSQPEHGSGESDEAATTGTTSVALVLAGRRQQVNDWVDSKYGKLKAGRGRQSKRNWNAGAAGRQAAANADLGGSTGIGGLKGALGR